MVQNNTSRVLWQHSEMPCVVQNNTSRVLWQHSKMPCMVQNNTSRVLWQHSCVVQNNTSRVLWQHSCVVQNNTSRVLWQHSCVVQNNTSRVLCNTQRYHVECRITLLAVLQNTPTVLLLHYKGCSRSTPLNTPGVPNWHMQPSTPKGVPETPFF